MMTVKKFYEKLACIPNRMLENENQDEGTEHEAQTLTLLSNVSNVTLVGSAVQRSTGPWSASVHASLMQLERVGFSGAPRFLGIDARGQELLSYIPGVTIQEANHTAVSLARLESAGRLLRRAHEALEGFSLPDGIAWHPRYRPLPEEGPLSICHMDAHPANTVFVGDRAVAFIDWDMAGPVPRVWDVAWSVWSYAPLADDEVCRRMGWRTPPDRLERLRCFCDAYGLTQVERQRLPGLVVRLAQQQIADIERAAQSGAERARFLVEVVGYPRLVRWRLRWIRDHRDELRKVLS